MTALRSSAAAVALLLANAVVARAEGPTIEHSAIKCLVVGKYRKVPARFEPPEVAQPRAFFRPEGVPSWYYVEMKPEAALGHVGVFPKPTKKLVGRHIEYYLEAASRDFDTGRTPEYDPIVVAKESECQSDPVVALYSPDPPAAVFPSVPEGFAIGGGVAGGTMAAIVGGGVAVGAAAVVIAKGDEDPIPATQPPVTSPPVTQPPVTSPPVTQPPAPADVACQADPRQGRAPLEVKFRAQASGGNGVFDFAWTFGDGGTSSQVNPSHIYVNPGVYEARVQATSVDRSATCSRSITVLATSFRLAVSLPGTGTGRVTGEGIDCPGDCDEEYAPGASVTLTAQATGGSTFAGWGGACGGTGPCSLSVNGDLSVSATFNAPPAMFPLTVSVGGSGTGTVSGGGINCPGTCSQTYTAGTPVALTATPTGISAFGVWGGDCAGTTGLTCNLVMNGPRTASATFTVPTTFRLTVTVVELSGAVAGVDVVPSPFGICNGSPTPGTTCNADYAAATNVTLRPIEEVGSHIQWTGDCAGIPSGASCVLAMTVDRNVGSTFGIPAIAQGPPTIVSRLDAPAGRAQATLNGAALAPVARGVQTIVVSVVEGENRLEAQLVEGARGTWTFDLSGVPGLERGSVRALGGDVVSLGADSVAFKLTGRAGERIAVAFTKR